jgi:threonine synthase
MARASALACVGCGARYPLDRYASDCPDCRKHGAPANLSVVYDGIPGMDVDRASVPARPASMWRWDAFLPAAGAHAVTLGEGDTPLLPAPALDLGDVWIKDESRNPTWSFKDRLASAAITMARTFEAKIIVSSSSGNAGAAAAAYAAKAGLPCIVFTFEGAPADLVTQIRAYGAMVVMVREKEDRWRLMSAAVREFGWYPTSPFFGPAVGSNAFGVEGYKTIAFEIAEAFDWNAPDWCVLPVCYGDALHGMWKGFEELRAIGFIDRVPRFVAAEVSDSLTTALASGASMPPDRPRNRPTIAVSIGASQGTVQALTALQRTDGRAVRVDDDALDAWLLELARIEGIWAEPAAVAPFAAIERLRRDGTITAHDRVVALVTASGMKDTEATEALLPPPPIVTGGLDEMLRALQDTYGFLPE